MRFLSARRAISAGIVAAASVAALAAPGTASAVLPGHCKGASTEGAGSSFQAEAEVVWDKGFEVNKAGCPGGPKVTYKSIGSGAGYKQWHELHLYSTVGLVGTDNTVNTAEKEAVEAEVEKESSKVLTIPIVQGAEAIVMNLPENCEATSTVASGRLGLDDSTLEGIYKGSITTWKQIEEAEGTGNKLTGVGCNTGTAITPVVRKDGSGTTHIFKKFLGQINAGKMEFEGGTENTWAEAAEGGAINKKWPTAAKVKIATTETNTGVLKTVAETPGAVGYADLAQARNVANGGFTGQSKSRFWAVLESSHKEKKGVITSRKYQDPSTNGDTLESANSNCKKTVYANGAATFPPPTVEEPWNEVTSTSTSKTYPLCGLTYALVLTNYEAYKGGTATEAQTVRDFMEYALNKKGGGKEIKNKDYFELPKGLNGEALAGVQKIEA